MAQIKKLKEILLVLLIVILVLPIAVSYYWVNDAGVLTLDQYQEGANNATLQVLEEQSLVHKEALRYFYQYSQNHKTFEEWINNYLKTSELIEDGEVYLVTSNIELNGLSKNNCSKIYCYQNRLDFSQIPSAMWRGLIGIEDYRFLSHQGVDPFSIIRALVVDIISMRFVQGGSTLTMQLVKNLFLTSEKSIIRKLKEMVLAIYIELSYSKEEILTAYFNEVWWGSLQGIRIKGLHSASLAYFGKHPRYLSDYEAGILVSLLKGPGYYHPIRNTERLQQRVKVVMKKLDSLGLLADNESNFWSETDWVNWIKQLKDNEVKKPFYANWLTTTKQGEDFSEIERFFLFMGVERVKEILKERISQKDIAIKMISHEINCKECKILRFYSKFERDLDVALEKEKHQTGSIFKPIFYTEFIKGSANWEDLVETIPITLNLKSGKWKPDEASELEDQFITIEQAILKSRNRPTIRLAMDYGFFDLQESLKDYFPDLKLPLSEYPSQLIGAIELSVNEVNSLYRKFIMNECSINSDDVGVINEESVLFRLSNPNTTTIKNVANRYMKDLRFFGKTGTTNDGLDSWYTTFDGKFVHTIWFGLEGDRKNQRLLLSGASSAFRIFQEFRYANGKRFHELSCPKN